MKSKKSFIVLLVTIFLLLILLIGGYFLYRYLKPVTISAVDNSFNLTIPGKIKLKTREFTDADYKLDLYSVKDKMFLNTLSIEKKQDLDLEKVVSEEKSSLSEQRKEIKEVSETQKIDIRDYLAYQYHYQYYEEDFGEDVYCQIVWIQTQNTIYVLDLEVVMSNQAKYLPIFEQIISSFEEIHQ